MCPVCGWSCGTHRKSPRCYWMQGIRLRARHDIVALHNGYSTVELQFSEAIWLAFSHIKTLAAALIQATALPSPPSANAA